MPFGVLIKAKDLFWLLSNDFEGGKFGSGYGFDAKAVLETVKAKGTGFVVDIAERYLNNSYKMSDKQTWCIAFAYEKINN